MAQLTDMKKRGAGISRFRFIAWGVIVSLPFGLVIFGLIAHEVSHALACIIFGIPIISLSIDHVYYVGSPNNSINVLINSAGGFGQALSSFVFFLLTRYYLVKSGEDNLVRTEVLEEKVSKTTNIIFGVEASLLTITVLGIINALVEGFFNALYSRIYTDSSIWLGVLALSFIIVSFVLYNSQRKYLR